MGASLSHNTVRGLAPLARQHPRARQLVRWWPMSEGAGSTVSDLTGQSSPLTLTNMDAVADWGVGPNGRTLDFDGSNDYCAYPADVTFSGTFTLAVWAYPRTLTSGTQMNVLLGKTTWGDAAGVSTDNMLLLIGTTLTNPFAGGFVTNAWQHYCVARDAANTLTFYRNGQAVGTVGGITNTLTLNTVGQLDSGGFHQYWDGQMADARIYSRALGSPEVASLYTHPQLEYAWAMQVMQRQWIVRAPAGGISAADGSSAGTATALATGASIASATASSTGVATAAATTASSSPMVAASTGAATGAATGTSVASATASSPGTASPLATGSSTAAAVASSTGTATADAVGSSPTGVGTSTGVAEVLGVGASTASATAASAGSSTTTGEGSGVVPSTGSSAGVATLTAVGISRHAGVFQSTAVAALAGVGASVASSTAAVAGVATPLGSGQSTAASVFTASSLATVLGVGALGGATALATGLATVTGIGITRSHGVGSSAGVAVALGVGDDALAPTGGGSAPWVRVIRTRRR